MPESLNRYANTSTTQVELTFPRKIFINKIIIGNHSPLRRHVRCFGTYGVQFLRYTDSRFAQIAFMNLVRPTRIVKVASKWIHFSILLQSTTKKLLLWINFNKFEWTIWWVENSTVWRHPELCNGLCHGCRFRPIPLFCVLNWSMFNAFYVKNNMKELIMKEKWHLEHFHLIVFALS